VSLPAAPSVPPPSRRARRSRPSRRRRPVRLALPVAALVVAGVVAAACSPPPEPAPPSTPSPPDIAEMSDEELEKVLSELAPDVTKALEDPDFVADVPREHRASVEELIGGFATPEGRKLVAERLREAAVGADRGLPTRVETIDPAEIGIGTGDVRTAAPNPTPPPERDGRPADAADTSYVVDSTSGPCAAPHGVGDVPIQQAPDRGGALLTPQHDVYTVPSPSDSPFVVGPLVPTGQEPIPGQGPGVTFRGALAGAGVQQMLVRVHLEDPKGYGPAALMPIIRIRPIGGSAADEYEVVPYQSSERPYVRDARWYCYAGDESDAARTRGYFEGWIPVPRNQPGFQVIVEVVENDYWFATQPVFPRDVLATPGPQYFAGADRSTIHVGAPAVTSAQPIDRSIGAFASAVEDRGGNTPNVLTDTNNQPADDLEQPIRRLIRETIRQKLDEKLADDLASFSVAGLDIVYVQAVKNAPIEVTTDLRLVDPTTDPRISGSISGEIPGAFRALAADIDVEADLTLNTSFLGVACHGFLKARVDASVDAWVWADSTANSTGMDLRLLSRNDSDVNLDLEGLGWFNPTCVLSRAIGPFFYGSVDTGIREGIAGGLVADPDNCADNLVLLPQPGSSMAGFDWRFSCPQFDETKLGTLGELLHGFDLNAYLPSVANLKPVVTDIDNAWCRATGAPAGCDPDMSVIGTRGIEVTADATVLGSLGDAFGAPLQGRFRNVYAPPTYSKIEDVVVSHRDMDGSAQGIGLVVDPRTINLALRHLAQGSSTTRTTNGLFDIADVELGPLSVSVRPEVAPIMLSVPPPDDGPIVSDGPGGGSVTIPSQQLTRFVFPDLRVDVRTAPNTPPIQFAVSARADVGVSFDSVKGRLVPVVSSPTIDLQAVGGCQADYVQAYWASYLMCGRAGGGTGLPNFGLSGTSLTDILNYALNDLVLPALTDAVGGLKLPDLSGLLPGFHVALTDVHSELRGGHLAVYAGLKPAPRASIAISEERLGDGSLHLRFFPSNLVNLDVQNNVTHYQWVVRDEVTGEVVAAAEYPNLPSDLVGSNYAVWAPVESFALTSDNLGQYRSVSATLTISQPGTATTVVATGSTRWYLPKLPPPAHCPNQGFAKAMLAAPGQPQPPLSCP
jgi:hypothetical protein